MDRPFWRQRAESLLKDRNVLWIAGVRRAGKTTLCQSFENTEYFDCERPQHRQQMEDPESFLAGRSKPRVILDEIHRLVAPTELLKIAADHFPQLQVVATGSSTLAARKKFRDTLTGRKHVMHMVPAIATDLSAFSVPDLDRRMLHGGLPPFLLEETLDDLAYQEWLDSYWAKDVQELFTVERRASFFRLMELLFRQSGELFEAQAFTAPCELSRQTVMNYLQILETTLLVHVLRPYAGGGASEIKSQPKVYGFDTGFVSYFKSIERLRPEDRGLFLEHLVLGELLARLHPSSVYYWRNKNRAEVDFVVKPGRSRRVTAIECKSSYRKFTTKGLLAFRKVYPEGDNVLVALDVVEPRTITMAGMTVRVTSLAQLGNTLPRM